MIDNTKWPQESRELADSILPDELKRLLMQLDIYILLIPYEPDKRVTYTDELSKLFHNVGRCEVISQVAMNIYVLNNVHIVGELLTKLLNHIDYDDTRDSLIDMTRVLRKIIASLNYVQRGVLTVEDGQ